MIFENRPLKHVLLHKTCRTGGKSILIGSIKITDYPTCTEIHTSSYTCSHNCVISCYVLINKFYLIS